MEQEKIDYKKIDLALKAFKNKLIYEDKARVLSLVLDNLQKEMSYKERQIFFKQRDSFERSTERTAIINMFSVDVIADVESLLRRDTKK